MMIEIMGVAATLRRWKQNPGAPACKLSLFSSDRKKSRPFSNQEVVEMDNFLKRHAPTTHQEIFQKREP